MSSQKKIKDCIPVGCVPSTARGVGWGGVCCLPAYWGGGRYISPYGQNDITFPQLLLRTVMTQQVSDSWVTQTELLFSAVDLNTDKTSIIHHCVVLHESHLN